MKSFFALVLLVFLTLIEIRAQKPIVISEDSITLAKHRFPGLTVTIPEANFEKTLKDWTKTLQASTKSKLVTENSEMTIFGARIKEVSVNPVNIYSKLMNFDTTLKLTVVFELKKDVYIERSTGEADLTNAKNYLKEFARSQYLEVAKDQAETEDKKLHDLEKELTSLEKEKEHLQKSIQSDNSTIMSEKENIAVQNNELASVSPEIIEQNGQLASMEEGAVKKAKVDYINDLEKKKKKALSSIESSQNRINKLNNEIDKANFDIPKNERMQEETRLKIEKQQAACRKYEDKVETIKTY